MDSRKSYISAARILPAELMAAIQDYTDGVYIYIPRKKENRRSWGELKNSKAFTARRNREIYSCYRNGIKVNDLAEKFCLSEKAVYKILASQKKQVS